MTDGTEPYDFEPDTWDIPKDHRAAVERLSRDLAAAGRVMGAAEARFLVDSYYTMQNQRKRAHSQRLALDKGADVKGKHAEPHVVLDWLFDQSNILENQLRRALDQYSQGHQMGDWMRRIVGIGPVISAGLLANIERPRQTVGQIYQFAGIAGADQKKWNTGELRPWNARLKVLCWHAGQSFMKLSARDDCYYGKHYRERKEFEQRMSDTGQRTETAAEWLPRMKNKRSPTYKHYSEGRLPPSQIDARARRWAVKLFLSHLNEVWAEREGMQLRAPFAIANMGHTTYIPPPFR